MFCQTQTGQVTGAITDPQSSAVPGATVTVTNVATQVARTAESNVTGNYTVTNLMPGNYQVAVSKEGFQKAVSQVFSVDVNQGVTVDIRMQVGAVTETVNVSAEATLLAASSAQLGTVVTQEKILDLPLNARNFTQLLTLTAGAAPVSVAQNSGGAQVQRVGSFVFPAVNGQTNRSNAFRLDGVYNDAHWMNTYAVAPNVDALSQFKVQSHSDQAEFGGVAGGVVNIASKNGTNEYHGTAYEFLRNDALDASAFFAARKPPLRQNQFGATLGGPIRKDKTFFFFSYEGYRQTSGSSALYVVPTPAQLSGDFSAQSRRIYNPFSTRPDPANPQTFLRDPFPNNIIPASLINPATRAWAQAIIPAPIDTGNPAFNGRNTTSQTYPANNYSIRLDHNFTPNDFLWARYTWGEQNQTTAGLLQGTTVQTDIPAKNAGMSYSHVFSPSTLFNVLFGYSGLTNNSVPVLTDKNLFQSAPFLGFPDKPGLNAPGVGLPSAFGTQGSRVDFMGPQEAYQIRADLSHITGRHSLKFGGEIVWQLFHDDTYDGNFAFNAIQTADLNNPGNTGSDIASFVLGAMDAWEFRDRIYDYESQLWNFYVQDSWKATDKLTINLGMRWDLLRNPAFSTNLPSTWDFNNGTFVVGSAKPPACGGGQIAPCLPDPNNAYVNQYVRFTGNSQVVDNDYKMFGPRFGFAYRVQPSLVVRGGFGIFYDLEAGVMQMAQNASGAWPRTDLIRGININRPNPTSLANNTFNGVDPRVPAVSPATAQAFFFDPNYRNAYSEQWNFEIQKEFSNNMTLAVGYVGSHGSRLDVGGFYNTALTPGPGAVQPRAMFPWATASNYDRSIGRSSYNALQVKVERRLAGGLSFLSQYTWSKSIDTASSGWFGVESQSLQNPYDINADRSVSGFDVPHFFSTALVYALPFGHDKRWLNQGIASRVLGNWQVNSIIMLRSGQSFTPTMGIDVANIGNATTRPNLVSDPHPSSSSPEAWFLKGAYAAPAAYHFGTSGRNQLRTQGFRNLDFSVFREDALTERLKTQFRVEAFNLFNTPTFGTPQTTFTNPNFGRVSSTVSTARQIQLGLKLIF